MLMSRRNRLAKAVPLYHHSSNHIDPSFTQTDQPYRVEFSPNLIFPSPTITFVQPNSVVVSWPNTGSYTLQTNGNLSASSWVAYGGMVTTSNGTNSITITPPAGNLFFRLSIP